jgi:hypothetical protein
LLKGLWLYKLCECGALFKLRIAKHAARNTHKNKTALSYFWLVAFHLCVIKLFLSFSARLHPSNHPIHPPAAAALSISIISCRGTKNMSERELAKQATQRKIAARDGKKRLRMAMLIHLHSTAHLPLTCNQLAFILLGRFPTIAL